MGVAVRGDVAVARRALVVSSVLFAAACGRTDLDRREVVLVDGGAASVGASPADAGLSDAMPDGAAMLDAGADVETPPPPPPCPVAPVGAAVALVSFPDSPAGVPRLVTLDDGASGAGARVAIGTLKENANTWHPEYRVARAEVLPAWPSGLSLDQPLVVWGVDSHAWAEMTSLPSGGLALLQNYGGELSAPVGVKLRPFDTTTWTPGQDTYVDQQGESPYGIAAGAASAR